MIDLTIHRLLARRGQFNPVQGIDRRDVKRFSIVSPVAVRGRIGSLDRAQVFAFGRKDPHATGPRAIEIALTVHFHPIGKTGRCLRRCIVKNASVFDRAIGVDIVTHPDFVLFIRNGNIKDFFVRGEGDTVGPGKVLNNRL
jgi:hypothetical protein